MMIQKKFKRIIAFFIAVLMCISLLPVSVFAEKIDIAEEAETEGGLISKTLPEEVPVATVPEEENANEITQEDNEMPTVEEVTEGALPEAEIEGALTEGNTSVETTLVKVIFECEQTDDFSGLQVFNAEDNKVEPYVDNVSGTCGSNLVWELSKDGTLAIFPTNGSTGKMTDYVEFAVKWGGYSSEIKEVIVWPNVTNIGNYAFAGCINLEKVSISYSGAFSPDTVWIESIGSYAFYGCTNLESINLGFSDKGLRTIGAHAFQDCNNLKNIDIPKGVTSIGSEAFYDSGLTTVSIPSTVSYIDDDAFGECKNLTYIDVAMENEHYCSRYGMLLNSDASEILAVPLKISGSVEIPSGVTSIGDWAFYNCSSLTSVTIQDGVTSIGDQAFYNCSSLTSVIIPDSVTSIGDWAFANCFSLNEIHVDSIEQWLSYNSDSDLYFHTYDSTTPGKLFIGGEELKNLTIPSGVKSIRYGAFFHCSSLTRVTIPGSVTSIGDEAFYCCDSLTSVTIQDGVTSIGYGAFCRCNSLTSVIIPDSVTSIGDWAFSSCFSLNEIHVDSIEQWLSYNSDSDLYLQSYPGKLFIGGEELKNLTIPSGVKSIRERAFFRCSSLTRVTIPSSVANIGDRAFEDCDSLTSVTIPDSVTSIGNSAFEDCDSLTSVTIPSSVTSIGNSAFEDCDSLTSVTIPSSVANIGDRAFYNCSSLTRVTIQDGVTSIGDRAFYNCSSLTSVIIPDSVTSIGDYAFACCFSLNEIHVDSIEQWLSYNSDSDLHFYDSTTPGKLFIGGEELKNLTIPSGVKSIRERAFNCSSLTRVTIQDGVTSIGDFAFSYCSSLTSVTIPDSVTSIGYGSFSGTLGLKTVFYGGTETQWNALISNELGAIGTIDTIVCFNGDTDIGSGTCGDNLTWTLDDGGILTISGKGTMENYSWDTMPWCDYKGYITNIVISDGVTSIGDYAFFNIYSLNSVKIPETVTSIGSYAFNACQNLTSISISQNVVSIGSRAFSRCSHLINITVDANNENYKSIDNVLYNKNGSELITCSTGKIGAFTVPDGVISIAPSAFEKCIELTEVSIPDSTANIGSSAFGNCSKLTSVTIPSSVTSISSEAFIWCTGLKTISIPASISDIGNQSFYECTSLTDVYFGGTENRWNTIITAMHSRYGGDAGNSCLENANIHFGGEEASNSSTCGDNLTWTLDSDGILKISGTGDMYDYELGVDVSGHMGSSAPWNRFYDSIHTVYISQNVTSIGDYAFTGCTVSDVTISESVLSIGAEAFEYCHLTNVQIPGKVGEIGAGAFLWCQSLTDINVSADNTHFCSIDGVLFNKDATEIIAFPTARTGSYSIPETVKTIGEYSFAGSGLTNVTVPESVTGIGARAFMNSQLVSVVIPTGVTEIPDYLFAHCNQLESITIPVSVKSIGLSAFNIDLYLFGRSLDVYYGGTETQWDTIKIGSYNGSLRDATLHFGESNPLDDFTITVPPAMSGSVTITAPTGGWVIGENTFSVAADKACVLAVSYDGGQTYTKLTATANGDGTYSFDVNIADENTVIACAYEGDANGDGNLSSGDVSRLNAGILHKVDMSPLSILACDVNGDGELSSGDISRLNAAILNKVKLSW